MSCSLQIPIPIEHAGKKNTYMKFSAQLTQVPVICNSATTGHKLQGQTKTNLVIAVWSARKNWNYVALSRVATRSGLHLVTPLPFDSDFSLSPDLVNMLTGLRAHTPARLNWNIQKEERILEERRRTAGYRASTIHPTLA